jgi:hypothetical protein
MKHLTFLLLSLVGFSIGYVLTNSIYFGLCSHDQYVCREIFNKIGGPLIYGMGALAIVFLVLLFSKNTWGAWKKFAMWFVPLATLLFIFYPEPGSGDLFSPYPETIFKWVSGIYVVISLVIILMASLKKK